MKIACLGGGPGGLYFAISMKLRDPNHDIVLFERNHGGDTFGWGVVLSDETLANLNANDPVSATTIRADFAYWDDIAVHYRGQKIVSSGHGFCGIGRYELLLALQRRAQELGVDIRFDSEVDADQIAVLQRDYDLVVASDGVNSTARSLYAAHFCPEIEVRRCKYIWLGTHQKFDDAFTFIFHHTDKGWIWAHAYQFNADMATFIVECAPETWDALGFADYDGEQTLRACERLFADDLGGHALISNMLHLRGSAWLNFNRVLCERWFYGNLILLGDAAATAHFSIGSGTKLAFESAIALARLLDEEESFSAACERYQEERRLDVLRLQSAARNSTEWFEHIERYLHLDPVQFNYSLLTRSQRIGHENLRARDPHWLGSAERWFQERAGLASGSRLPMFAPYRLRDMALGNRVVISPMAQYKAVDGCPTDWHLVHYGERAKGGAGLVYIEMSCVSASGRITPGCTGLYAPAHERLWKRLVDFVHGETEAKLCIQIGHAGGKGSTQLGWEKMDAPLAADNWDLLAASARAWSPDNAIPRAMDRDDMDRVRDQFVAATRMAARAGFDMIELHAAHGYLLSSFISPLSNDRDDGYGGDLFSRMRYPLEVCRAMRSAWPASKPMSVRISAHDWVGSRGIEPVDAVAIARYFAEAGVDIIDVSAGQTSIEAAPVYGRMFQTPFSDHIRQETGLPTMAVGNIYEADHVNSILMAGRADLVCLGRPHLANPYWTHHAAIVLGDREQSWPLPYLAGRDQMVRLVERGDGGG